MQRELAQWDDAFKFDCAFGEAGPDEIERRVDALNADGRGSEARWWIDVAAKLVRLHKIRAEPNQ